MSRIIKVTFNLSIGLSNAERTGDFDFEFKVEDNATDEEINNTLEEYWQDWIWNYIDGGWEIKSDEKIE